MDVTTWVARGPVGGERRVPASKSLHQRALVLAALAAGETQILTGLEDGEVTRTCEGEDVRRLRAALEAIGRWSGDALGDTRERLTLDLGLGATGFRFAVAAATLRPDGARTLVRGHRRLLARPHVQLRRALRRLGGRVKRRRSGSIRVRGGGLRGGSLSIRADVSSQYASALMLVAPRVGGLELTLLDRPVSRPYLDLTMDVLRAFGVRVEAEGLDAPRGRIRVAEATPEARSFRVEADASSAAPWWAAAALTGGRVVVQGLPAGSHQADAALLEVLARCGASVEQSPDGIAVTGRPPLAAPGEVDLRHAPDLLPLVGVLAAVAEGTTRVVGAQHARFKESDRFATTAAGIRALGGRVTADDGVLEVRGGGLHGGRIDAAGDHRLVLAFGVLGLVVPGIVIGGAEAVEKSYPTFLEEFEEAAGAS